MRGLVFDGRLQVVDDLARPEAAATEALIRVRVAGICKTDLEITRGYKGFRGVLGHEFVGEVETSPDASWTGKRVCGEINIRCGRCAACRHNLPAHCADRRVVGILDHQGAFADYLTLPVENLHEVPSEIPDEEAVFAEPLAAAYEILEQLPALAGDRVVVLGDGKLGLLCAQVVRTTGARIELVGKHEDKLAIARELGIPARFFRDSLPEDVDVVVEATGSVQGLALALDIVRPRGTVVLKSTVADTTGLDLSPVVVNELTVLGSRCGPFPKALEALRSGRITVAPLISARYPLESGVGAMERAAEHGSLKVLLQVSG